MYVALKVLVYWLPQEHNYLGFIIYCGIIKGNITNIICLVVKNSLLKLFSGKRSESNTASRFVS